MMSIKSMMRDMGSSMLQPLKAFLETYAGPNTVQEVSAQTVADLEKSLGQGVPDPLRSIYVQLGTGWGPETGLLAVSDSLQLWSQWTGEKPDEYAAWQWPPHVFPFLDWGCQIYSCLDLTDGRVLRFRGDNFVPDDPDGGGGQPTQAANFAQLLSTEAASLDAWIASWIDGTLKF